MEATHLDLIQSKAKMDRLQHGDRNSALFHTAMKARGSGFSVNLDLGDKTFTNDFDMIGNAAAAHFTSIFQGHTPPLPDHLMDIISPVITEAKNQALNALPTEEDILNEILNMNGDSSPGRDGFTGHFHIFH
ncbi:unnamed protein product [Rhodiola kirilowii]